MSRATAIPMIHQTDLFHVHGDPDDHFDLATVYALAMRGNVDLRAILIDFPPPRRMGNPAVGAVAQLNWMTGTAVPVAVGSSRGVTRRGQTPEGFERSDLGGVNLLVDQLRASDVPVVINIVGSAIDVALAASREPHLFAEKCAGIYLNAGSGHDNPNWPGKLEFNVELNTAAYSTIFDIPCPIYWCPCWNVVEIRQPGERGTFWWLEQRQALPQFSGNLQRYFIYCLSQEPSHKWLTYLNRPTDARQMDWHAQHKRGMWSTAGFIHGAGLSVTRGGDIVERTSRHDPLFQFDPVRITCEDNGVTRWEPDLSSKDRFMIRINDVTNYEQSMNRAIISLLKIL